jgi:tetratricopeptide (TPR) repeat protein
MDRPVRRSILAIVLAFGCSAGTTRTSTTEPTAPAERDAFAIYQALEDRIESDSAAEDERVDAYQRAATITDDESAAYAFARAALAGRVAELRGAKAGKLVTEAEDWARKSIERDPEFRDRAATQLLGSLYVMAPGRLVEHGDSETGLEMLEGLVQAKPDAPAYRFRLAQAYAHLGDDDAAKPHLCASLTGRERLRTDEQRVLDELVEDAGGPDALACAAH